MTVWYMTRVVSTLHLSRRFPVLSKRSTHQAMKLMIRGHNVDGLSVRDVSLCPYKAVVQCPLRIDFDGATTG